MVKIKMSATEFMSEIKCKSISSAFAKLGYRTAKRVAT